MPLTVCLVTRDHAGCLAAALDSVRVLEAPCVVADAGSTDATLDIARAHGATVVPLHWADDFAAACNAALDAVTTDWVLWMNPDETLSPPTAHRFGPATRQPDALAFLVRVQQQLRPDRPAYGTANPQWRLFRRHPGLRYRGRTHPRFDPAPEAVAVGAGLVTATLDAVIVRHAYHSAPTPDKTRWTNRLLEAELRDRPDNLDARIELGRNLLQLNDPRGHDVLAEAAAQAKPGLDAGEPPTNGSGPLVEYLLNVAPEWNRGPIDRSYARGVAIRWYLRTPPILWTLAGERYRAKDFATAATFLTQLLDLGRAGDYDNSLGFDPDIMGHSAMMNLGQCYLQLNLRAEARGCFEALQADETHGPRATELLAALGAPG